MKKRWLIIGLILLVVIVLVIILSVFLIKPSPPKNILCDTGGAVKAFGYSLIGSNIILVISANPH